MGKYVLLYYLEYCKMKDELDIDAKVQEIIYFFLKGKVGTGSLDLTF